MFPILRYLRNHSSKVFLPIWFFFGSIFRLIVKKLNLNFSVSQNISIYGPFKMHAYFAFSDFKNWGSKASSIFSHMMLKCKNKKCVIDIGAHIGLMTMPISSILEKDGKIFCFEPSRINYKFLNYHLSLNKIYNAITINKLVGNKNKNKVYFYESNNPTGMNSIIKLNEKKNINFKKTIKKQISLDGFVNLNNIKPDLIKIDAEGSEIYILQGAINTIKKYKPDIFISIHKNYIKKIGQTDKQLFKLLNKINYQIKDSSGMICKYLENKEYFLSLK